MQHFPQMEQAHDIIIKVLNTTALDSVVKNRKFNLIVQATEAETGELLSESRLRLTFNLKSTKETSAIPSGVEYLDDDDYTKQITDSKGCKTCRLVIKELSRKWEGELYLEIIAAGSERINVTPNFKVVSKRKAPSSEAVAAPKQKRRKLMDVIEYLETRVQELEQRVRHLEGLLANKQ